MKYKFLYLLIAIGVVLISLQILKVDTFSKDYSNENIRTSSHSFITKYYKELLGKGSKSIIRQYYLEPLDEETLNTIDRAGWVVSHKPLDEKELEDIIHVGRHLKRTEKFEFQGMTIISKKPLIIEVAVKEWNKSEIYSHLPFGESLFILKDIGECSWKIVDIIGPGMP